ncbi:MAG: shikimate dehydrogenase [Acidobacteriota bacterium]
MRTVESSAVRVPRLPKICVAIQGATPAEMFARAEAALRDTRFLEFRLDSLARPAGALTKLRAFLSEHSSVVAIATCRRKPNSGAFSGSVKEELDLLAKAAGAGCRIVDVEVESAEQALAAEFTRFRKRLAACGAALLVSFHDFARTIALEEAADRIAAFEPDFVKVVSTAETLADNLSVLRLIEDRSVSGRVVGIAMGEEGSASRVLGPREGAAFTFASLEDGIETAPGQVSAHAMRKLYRADRLNAETLVFGVAGNPIAHSLSPLIHNTAFARAGVNAVLLPLKVRAVADLLLLLRELPFGGAAVTMPLKQQILPHLDWADPLVKRIGACNTLRVIADGKLFGYNTDVAGVVRPLESRIKLKGARIAVLGAGGAARAAAFGLTDCGAEVFIVNRTHEHAVQLARAAKATALRQEQLERHTFDAVINSTPCGMAGFAQALPIDESQLNTELVFDMVYNPMRTPLLRLAEHRGLKTISGVEMFVQQAVRQFEIWTGKTPPEDAMHRVVVRALRAREKSRAAT